MLNLTKRISLTNRLLEITEMLSIIQIQRLIKTLDLKVGHLKHQMQMYVNYYDRKVTLEDENPTIGII